ncbi:sensor domain-containing protein [Aestuariispira insulae]|uniref:PAS domain S-box-containing protein/diguanylate cyclase (GGDEF)-like protein n=1 Tax=Aestuariispira insulae TaxID=1461337 RepID=A0A3D9HVM0_9PROT|nr:bifunctional diguanylate cyclase/phosphodiesterase [Aestuariispira insulae]RED53431.1 PAS domain S-box-containing protein/diguanylate cyclase (GGDEF)-like protein [Aestuariispira insulae]
MQASDSLAVITEPAIETNSVSDGDSARGNMILVRLGRLAVSALFILLVTGLDVFVVTGHHMDSLYLLSLLFVMKSKDRADLFIVSTGVTLLGVSGALLKDGTAGHGVEWPYLATAVAVVWVVAVSIAIFKETLWTQDAILENIADGIVMLNDSLRIVRFNKSAEQIFGYDRNELKGAPFNVLLSEPEKQTVSQMLGDLILAGGSGKYLKTEVSGRRGDGSVFPLQLSVRAARVRGRRRYYAVLNDLTGQRETNEKLWKLSNAVEQSSAATIITDLSGRIEYVNRRFCELSGYEPDDVLGQNTRILRSDDPQNQNGPNIWQTINNGESWRGEFHNRKKNGEYYWVEAAISPIKKDGRITHFMSVQEDISVRKEYEAQLERQANYDDLTGFPNRLMAMERLGQALEIRNSQQTNVAVMIVDLDQFNAVNDTLGHHSGDLLIRETAFRIKQTLDKTATLARLGGDEFLVILPAINTAKLADKVASRILEAIEAPFVIDEQEIYVTASIGVSIAPDDGTDAHSLLKNADAALFLAKKDGRNTYRFFKAHMNEAALQRLEMVTKLRKAIANDELSVHYQPLFDIATGNLVTLEALIRWNHPKEGWIAPDQFIPVAEETGLIKDIGDQVLRRACADVKEIMYRLQRPVKVAVNISARQFKDGHFDEKVLGIIASQGIVPEYLELEITERLLMLDDPETAGILRRLAKAGVSLSIDDFGTGYSSLSYLKRYPFDVLKIDRAFVKDVTHDSQSAALVSAIIAMAQSLDLKVIAEGVEEEGQLAHLKKHGCDIAQGFLLGRPMSVADLTAKIHQWQMVELEAPVA